MKACMTPTWYQCSNGGTSPTLLHTGHLGYTYTYILYANPSSCHSKDFLNARDQMLLKPNKWMWLKETLDKSDSVGYAKRTA